MCTCEPPTQKAAGDATVSIFVAECDITDFDAVERVVAEANAFHGRATDHVVHAAVVIKPGYVWEQSPAQLHKDTGATYLGAIHLFKVCESVLSLVLAFAT